MTRPRAAADPARQPERSPGPGAPPAAQPAVRRYTELAPVYDTLTDWAAPYRSQAVHELGLHPGETILDVGCGTGLNFGLIQDQIGPSGLLVGVDMCPAMLARARARADRAGWDNVVLVCSPIERAAIPVVPHGVLFCAVHDILRSPAALRALLGQVPEGSRVVAAGAKWAPWWVPAAPAINWSVWAANSAYVSTFEGFDRPWSHLAGLLSGLTVHELAFGSFYLASGTTAMADGGNQR